MRPLDINQRMSTLSNRPPPLIPHGMFFFTVKNVKGHRIFYLMLHNHKRWAFSCPTDEVGSESLKPFEGLCSRLTMQLCWENLSGFTYSQSAADVLKVILQKQQL